MTDEKLIAHLRDSKGWPNLGNAAADRIEKLVKALAFSQKMDAKCVDNVFELEGKLDAAEARVLRYRAERNGLARKISSTQNLETASFEAQQKIANQRESINSLQARVTELEAEVQAARDKALEDAAKLVGKGEWDTPWDLAREIMAMKGGE